VPGRSARATTSATIARWHRRQTAGARNHPMTRLGNCPFYGGARIARSWRSLALEPYTAVPSALSAEAETSCALIEGRLRLEAI
jgi:hypothetical protein